MSTFLLSFLYEFSSPGSSVLPPHKRFLPQSFLYLLPSAHPITSPLLHQPINQSVHSLSHRERFSSLQPHSQTLLPTHCLPPTHIIHTTPDYPAFIPQAAHTGLQIIIDPRCVSRRPRSEVCHIAKNVPTNHRDLQSRPQRTSRLPFLLTTNITGLMESV